MRLITTVTFYCMFPFCLQVSGSKALSQGFREMRAGGLRSMWQGNAVNVLKGTPQSTLQCLVYAQVRPWISDLNNTWKASCFQWMSTLRASLFYPDEGLHSKQNPGASDGAAALRLGLHLRSSRSRCLLPFRGIRDQRQVWVLSHFCSVLYFVTWTPGGCWDVTDTSGKVA